MNGTKEYPYKDINSNNVTGVGIPPEIEKMNPDGAYRHLIIEYKTIGIQNV